jgi:hypothetical protein
MKAAIALFLVALMILPVLWRVRIMLTRAATARDAAKTDEEDGSGSPSPS